MGLAGTAGKDCSIRRYNKRPFAAKQWHSWRSMRPKLEGLSKAGCGISFMEHIACSVILCEEE